MNKLKFSRMEIPISDSWELINSHSAVNKDGCMQVDLIKIPKNVYAAKSAYPTQREISGIWAMLHVDPKYLTGCHHYTRYKLPSFSTLKSMERDYLAFESNGYRFIAVPRFNIDGGYSVTFYMDFGGKLMALTLSVRGENPDPNYYDWIFRTTVSQFLELSRQAIRKEHWRNERK